MSRLTELINELCPNGVEYRTLGEIIELDFGERIVKSKSLGTKYPVYGGGGESFRTDKWNRKDKCVIARFAISEHCVRHVDGCFWLMDSGITYNCKSESIVEEYIECCLVSMQHEIYNCSTKSAQRNLKTNLFLRLQIPVPPIEVQREIVRILDEYTAVHDELIACLVQQSDLFNYQRKSVLRDVIKSQSGEIVSLSELFSSGRIDMGRGKVISKRTIANNPGDYPVYSSSAIVGKEFGRYGDWMFDDARISWSIDGGGRFFYRDGSERYSVTNVCGWLKVLDSCIDTKYLYYALLTEWESKKFDYSHKAHPSVIRNEYMICLPTLDEQKRIVLLLDSYACLYDDLNNVLAEMQVNLVKQLSALRNELLTFPDVAADQR